MPSYDLYSSLGLDRGRTTDQLAAELDQRLAGTSRGAPQWQELADARAVLGDPTRRSMYDQRLGDPSQTVTPAEIQQLAAMNVGAVSGGTGTGGGLTGVIKQNPKLSATVGVLAVAVLVVGGLAIGGAVGGGDGDDTSSSTASGSSSSGGESGGESNDRVEQAKAAFASMNFAAPGATVDAYGYEDYTSTDNGEEKRRWSDTPGISTTISNMREVRHTEKGDASLPADHPDAADDEFNFACFDVEVKSARGPASEWDAYMDFPRPSLLRVNSGGFLEIGRAASDNQNQKDGEIFPELRDAGFTKDLDFQDKHERKDGVYTVHTFVDCWRTDLVKDLQGDDAPVVPGFKDSGSAGGYILTIGEVEEQGNMVVNLDEPVDAFTGGERGWRFEK